MKLSTLIATIDVEETSGVDPNADPEVTNVCYDSRKVGPGAVFVAITGFATDGHRFIDDAMAKGAVAVVCEKPVAADRPVFRVGNTRAALARLAVCLYGYPTGVLTLVGVTGTNGKTTVTYLLEQILIEAGLLPGVVGTINYRYAGTEADNPVTTPESSDLQAILRRMADAGVSHVVIEVSSHALDLHRVDGCRFDVAVFTNLTQDHLDHHGDMQHYWACKKRLFSDYLKPSDEAHRVRAVANVDDPKGRELADELGTAVHQVSVRGHGDITAQVIESNLAGIRGSILLTGDGEIPFSSSLVGGFNLENILNASAAAMALGVPPTAIAAGISGDVCVPGRLERISQPGGPAVFVDYAHTPDALENVTTTLRELTPGRLITVFGCGGDRDGTKRPLMGRIAAEFSDLCVITSDNPRSEDPLAIIAQVEVGVCQVSTQKLAAADIDRTWPSGAYLVEPDRQAAIGAAIGAAGDADAVLIAGKGHEPYQILANGTIHFDDREVARKILATMDQQGT